MLFKRFIFDKKGFYSILDGILAIFLIFIVIFAFNVNNNLNILNSNSKTLNNYNTAEDVLELMSEDNTLNSIYCEIEYSNNFNNAKYISQKYLNETIPNKTYLFTVNGKTLVSNINSKSDNYNSATRYVNGYLFSLSIY
ncbi:MAG: hypothetical protein ACI4RQ_00265 [Methanobrevibacter wolinii]|uniref:hypothetical protein n=1 Tax=Methanobrevibacter wolinii TaxID=190977 RepID=UPI0005B28B9F|nr:hypothetical protein [Methanobrevibacter wolinii]